MPDTDTPAAQKVRGRPATGKALTSTERNRLRAERLARAGWRRLGSVQLPPAAAAALEQLTAQGLTIDQAIASALEAAAAAQRAPLAPIKG